MIKMEGPNPLPDYPHISLNNIRVARCINRVSSSFVSLASRRGGSNRDWCLNLQKCLIARGYSPPSLPKETNATLLKVCSRTLAQQIQNHDLKQHRLFISSSFKKLALDSMERIHFLTLK